MVKIIDGKAVSKAIKDEVKQKVEDAGKGNYGYPCGDSGGK